MRPAPRTHRSPRPGFRHLTTVATIALAAGLLVPGPASAQPHVQNSTDDSAAPTLPAGAMVGLAPGARNVQVQESPGGATVAVLWQNPAATQVWARIKTRGTWRKKVRLSPARARATQPSMDLDSDGSLLVGWTEKRGKKTRVVARRLKGAKPGARRVFKATPTQGPQVGAGKFHDIIAWTARAKGMNRPFVSVDAGAGFRAPTRINGPHETFAGTLRVNSDGPQAHLLHVTKDTKKRVARSSWAVLDPERAKKWRVTVDVGPRQRFDRTSPEPPLVTFHRDTRVVMVFVNEQIAEDIDLPETPAQLPAVRERWSAGVTWSSRPNPRHGFGKWVELHNPPSDYAVDRVISVANVRGSIVAAHSGDQGLLSILMRPTDAHFDLRSTSILGTCRPFPDWFLTSLPATPEEAPTLACVDNEADTSAHLMADLYDNPLRRLSPQSSGTVRATVVDPLVAALAVTEDRSGGRDPVWLHDLTPGGRDSALPARKFTRRKAGRIRGRTTVGRKLTVTTGRWSPEPATVRYRWFVGKKRLKKATRSSLVLRPHMRGKRVRVKVTVVRDGYRNRTLTLRARGRVS